MPLTAAKHIPARRFTDKPSLDPSAVWSLPVGHAALREHRTLFPSTVTIVDENFNDRLLVGGENNRKLGKVITKGTFKGYGLFGLSLEERATCPASCAASAFCYGNGMQFARRHRIEDEDYFFLLLEDEIREGIAEFGGVLVRLHVLGDFPSISYVEKWASLLDSHKNLACYGYTHRLHTSDGGDEIGDAVARVKRKHSSRFRIRWSSDKARPDGTIIIGHVPDSKRSDGAIVCPAQTDATACCASCGLCWEGASRGEAIAFIKHGRKSLDIAAEKLQSSFDGDVRRVKPIDLPSGIKPPTSADPLPTLRLVAPTDLLIEAAYQRDLSGKSVNLIRKMLDCWDWAKFKPPVCADTEDGLFVIDGQHTAIAAASHAGIPTIPVMIVAADKIERRAQAFVSHNRDRLVMTAAQIFYGDLAAKKRDAQAIMDAVVETGAIIPRLPISRTTAKPKQVSAIGELRDIYRHAGKVVLKRVLNVAVLSNIAPISKTPLRALRLIFTEPKFSHLATSSDEVLAKVLAAIPNLEAACQAYAVETGQSRFRACAQLIEQKLVLR